ncbi:MAG: vitamin B12 dependent-methionine synthase activation domain-containing protein [Lachnospiraceae bacterium]|nr:vitamin B12 dependent-methionine synthase activation domain-containing protein [Lachnospiraceae bacterium]
MAATIISHRGLTREVRLDQIERYMGMGGVSAEGELSREIDRCRPLIMNAVNAMACYLETDVKVDGDTVDLSYLSIESKSLSRLMRGCNKAILIAATIGPKVDMLIKKEAVVSKASALVMNSVAVAAIESYMAELNEHIANEYKEYSLRPRFSPGYGDVPLSTQIDLLRVLDTNRKIGVALSDTLLMTPEKSVSAIIGLAEDGCIHIDKDCDICPKKDCEYRLGD